MAQNPLRQVAEHARWLYPLTVILLASILGQFYGLGLSLLIVAGGVLVAGIWLMWSSLQGLGGDLPITLDEALSLGAPSAEEEQKRAVLRALKDLEYERAVGKINDEDYNSLAHHYRNEAKRLLRVVDHDLGPERQRAERILSERLATRAAVKDARGEESPAARRDGAADGDSNDRREPIAGDESARSEPPAAKTPSSDVV